MQFLTCQFDRVGLLAPTGRVSWRALLVAGVLAWLTLAGIAPAGATPAALILERGYWEDTSAEARLSDASSQSFTPFEDHFSRGYSASAHWIRLKLDASAKPIGLRAQP